EPVADALGGLPRPRAGPGRAHRRGGGGGPRAGAGGRVRVGPRLRVSASAVGAGGRGAAARASPRVPPRWLRALGAGAAAGGGRPRMRGDCRRRPAAPEAAELGREYAELTEAYDRGGLPYERALTRLSYACWLMGRGQWEEADAVNAVTLALARRHGMRIVEAD